MGKINKLASEIINRGLYWNDAVCTEKTGNNDLACQSGDDLNYAMGVKPPTAYCASFASLLIDEACTNLKVENIFGKNPAVLSLYNNAKISGLKIDRTPTPGCIGIRRTDPTGDITTKKKQKTTGDPCSHAFIVLEYANGIMYTAEGNAWSDTPGKTIQAVGTKTYYNDDNGGTYWKVEDHLFLHTEDMNGYFVNDELVENPFQIVEKGGNASADDGLGQDQNDVALDYEYAQTHPLGIKTNLGIKRNFFGTYDPNFMPSPKIASANVGIKRNFFSRKMG